MLYPIANHHSEASSFNSMHAQTTVVRVALGQASRNPISEPQPSPAPEATPSGRAKLPYIRFATADLNLAPKVYNEFDPGNTGVATQTIRGAAEFDLTIFGKRSRRFVEIEDQRFTYPHPTGGPVTVIGGNGSAYVGATRLTENDFAVHSGVVGIGHTYLATSFLTHGNDYGYPAVTSTFGIGLERLPDLTRPFTVYADGYYYPEVRGAFAPTSGPDLELRYKAVTYEAGLVLKVPRSRAFLEIGTIGNHYFVKQNAPVGTTHTALTLGLGIGL